MRDFLSNTLSPSWWVGVVVVGIAINLASAYIKPVFDNMYAKVSKGWATRTQIRREIFLRRVETLRNNQHEQVMVSLELSRSQLIGISFMILGFLLNAVSLLLIKLKPQLNIPIVVHTMFFLG